MVNKDTKEGSDPGWPVGRYSARATPDMARSIYCMYVSLFVFSMHMEATRDKHDTFTDQMEVGFQPQNESKHWPI